MCKQESSSDEFRKIYTRKEIVMMETKKSGFIPFSTYQPYKRQPFTYHMCAYLVQITVVKCGAQPSNDVNYFNSFYVVVIILGGQLQYFIIKYNHNTMVEIDQCLYRVFHWNILVNCQKQISIKLHHHVNVMQYFSLFYLTIAYRMLLLLLYKASV